VFNYDIVHVKRALVYNILLHEKYSALKEKRYILCFMTLLYNWNINGSVVNTKCIICIVYTPTIQNMEMPFLNLNMHGRDWNE